MSCSWTAASTPKFADLTLPPAISRAVEQARGLAVPSCIDRTVCDRPLLPRRVALSPGPARGWMTEIMSAMRVRLSVSLGRKPDELRGGHPGYRLENEPALKRTRAATSPGDFRVSGVPPSPLHGPTGQVRDRDRPEAALLGDGLLPNPSRAPTGTPSPGQSARSATGASAAMAVQRRAGRHRLTRRAGQPRPPRCRGRRPCPGEPGPQGGARRRQPLPACRACSSRAPSRGSR
jgi:hypothetical protein